MFVAYHAVPTLSFALVFALFCFVVKISTSATTASPGLLGAILTTSLLYFAIKNNLDSLAARTNK